MEVEGEIRLPDCQHDLHDSSNKGMEKGTESTYKKPLSPEKSIFENSERVNLPQPSFS